MHPSSSVRSFVMPSRTSLSQNSIANLVEICASSTRWEAGGWRATASERRQQSLRRRYIAVGLGVFFGQVARAHGRAMLILPACPTAALCAPQAAVALGNGRGGAAFDGRHGWLFVNCGMFDSQVRGSFHSLAIGSDSQSAVGFACRVRGVQSGS